MENFFRVIYFILLNLLVAKASYAQQVKYEAEALLDIAAIDYKSLATMGDYDTVNLKVAVSSLILGAVIFDSQGTLMFPREDNWDAAGQYKVLHDLHRMAPLLESAKLTAWEKHTADALSLLYCRKDTISLCFLVDTTELANSLGLRNHQVLSSVLKEQYQPSVTLYAILFCIMCILLMLGWRYVANRGEKLNNLARIAHEEYSDALKIAALILNPSKLTIHNGDDIIHVGDKDMKLLILFASRPDEVISKEELYTTVWQRAFLSTSRALDQHMLVLRRKINIELSHGNILDIVHGQGYRYNKNITNDVIISTD